MIKRVELQHKVKYLGKEYSIVLHNDSDFTTAFKTLQYPMGIIPKTEVPLIGSDPSDYNRIFIEDGCKTIHFYSYNDGMNDECRKFIESMYKEYGAKSVFIFIIGSTDSSLYDFNCILETLYKDGEPCISYMSTDSNVEGISVRVVVGV